MAGGRSLLFLVGMLVLLCQPAHGSILDALIDDVIGEEEPKNATKTQPPAKTADDDSKAEENTDDDGTEDDDGDEVDDDGNEEEDDDEDKKEEEKDEEAEGEEAEAEAAAEKKRKEIIQKARENIADLQSIENLSKQQAEALKVMMDQVQELIQEQEEIADSTEEKDEK